MYEALRSVSDKMLHLIMRKGGLATLPNDGRQRGPGLTQIAAAKKLGIDQPKISRRVRGELYGFSTDQLMRFLNALGHDVEIVVRKWARRGKARGKLIVQAA